MKYEMSENDVKHIVNALGHTLIEMKYDGFDGSDNFSAVHGLFNWLIRAYGDVTLEDNLPF